MNKHTNKKAIQPKTSTSTRNAVESAIDMSKGDKSITWEKMYSRPFPAISRWPLKSSAVRQRKN